MRLTNVLPCYTAQNQPDSRLGNAETISDGLLRFSSIVPTPNISNRRIGQPCRSDPFSNDVSSFSNGVSLILYDCSEKQMVWPDTGWIVASMAHMDAIRYRPVSQFPGDSVCPRTDAAQHEFTVTVWLTVCCPQPTAISLLCVSPEAFLYRHWFERHNAQLYQ